MATHVVVLTAHYWGRGATLKEAQRQCLKQSGAPSWKAHLDDVGKKWVETHIETPEGQDEPYVDDYGRTVYFGEIVKQEKHG